MLIHIPLTGKKMTLHHYLHMPLAIKKNNDILTLVSRLTEDIIAVAEDNTYWPVDRSQLDRCLQMGADFFCRPAIYLRNFSNTCIGSLWIGSPPAILHACQLDTQRPHVTARHLPDQATVIYSEDRLLAQRTSVNGTRAPVEVWGYTTLHLNPGEAVTHPLFEVPGPPLLSPPLIVTITHWHQWPADSILGRHKLADLKAARDELLGGARDSVPLEDLLDRPVDPWSHPAFWVALASAATTLLILFLCYVCYRMPPRVSCCRLSPSAPPAKEAS